MFCKKLLGDIISKNEVVKTIETEFGRKYIVDGRREEFNIILRTVWVILRGENICRVCYSLSVRIKEFDRAYLLEDVMETPFVKGDVGIVVFVYPDNKAYEIEFVALDGTTLGVETVRSTQVKSVKGIKKVIHIDEAA